MLQGDLKRLEAFNVQKDFKGACRGFKGASSGLEGGLKRASSGLEWGLKPSALKGTSRGLEAGLKGA